jgi:hypothetical protein
MIQDQASRALEKAAGLLVGGEIDGPPDLEARLARHGLEDVGTPLDAAVPGLHRIEHDGAVGVEAHPVVREQRIGFPRLLRIFHHAHAHALRAERGGERVELRAGLRSDVAGANRMLKAIAGGGLGVEAERLRANHENRARALRRAENARNFGLLHAMTSTSRPARAQ